MSIYNDVRFTCPHCASKGVTREGTAHVPRILNSSTVCNLSDLASLRRLLEAGEVSPVELKQVAKCATEVHFKCSAHDAHQFEADPAYLMAIPLIADRYVERHTAAAKQRAEELFKEVYPD